MTDVEPDAPTEEEILTTGPGEEFNFERWGMALDTGKYDGFLLLMAAGLHERGIKLNRRRWRCTYRDIVYDEEHVSGEVADHAEQFAEHGWGYVTAVLGENVRATIRPARAVLYGICRAEANMTDRDARKALKAMTAVEVMACFDWYEVDPPGKAERPA